jgi:hypothetical protein
VLFAVDTPDGDRELTAEQIGREITAGTVNAETLVWRDGMPEWLEVKKVPELATFLKKPDPPKPGAGKPAAAAPIGRFRPRQPTLPMGALPDRAGAPKADAAIPEPTPRAPAEAKSRGPMPAPLESKRDAKAAGSLGARIPFIDPVPSDDEPTVLRSPDAVAALLSAATEERDDHTPVPPRLAAQLTGNRARPDAAGPAPLPPFGSRSGAGASARTAAERPTPPAPVPIGLSASQAPSSERRPPGSGPKVSPIDTFRESPEAKRAWFPEPVPGQPPLANPPREVSPSPPPLFANLPPPAESPPPPFAAPPPSSPAQPVGPVLQQPLQRPSPPPTVSPFAPANPPPFAAPTPMPLVAPPATAPAFASRPNFGTSGTAASVVLDDAALRPKRGKAGLWIVLLLLVIVIAGVAFTMLGGLKKPASLPPSPTPATAAAEQPPTGSRPEAPPSTAQADAPNAPATETAAAATGDAPAPAMGNRDPLAEPTAPPSTNSGFADLFAAGAKRAAGGRFDPKLAKAAFDALLVDASKCRERGGPTGITRVAVTFDPSGTVSSAVAQDVPIAGTATAACISQVFKRATIPPFTGSPGTITERISIQ